MTVPSLKPVAFSVWDEFVQMRGVKLAKNSPKCNFDPKWPPSCACDTMATRDFFVRLGMMNACIEFRFPAQNYPQCRGSEMCVLSMFRGRYRGILRLPNLPIRICHVVPARVVPGEFREFSQRFFKERRIIIRRTEQIQ